jgi:putative hemin transport protein
MNSAPPSAAEIRQAFQDNPKMRERDLAQKLNVAEAQLVAARIGDGVTPIVAHPDQLMPAAATLGEVMALTRNESCVSEKVGIYDNFHSGKHASMILTPEIDLRMFPAHWVHGFAVEKETDAGLKRSLQVFDKAGDAIHKIHLREGSDLAAWEKIKSDLAIEGVSDTLQVDPRTPVEAPKSREDKANELRQEWDKMTDTHQFLRVCSKLKMNRLGAYRVVGTPYVRALANEAVDQMLHGVRDSGIDFMSFVGNQGCIQIHNGPIKTLKAFGPWQNILDPGHDMHLRLDHIAEVYAVEKPTQRGPALSVEAFDTRGYLIAQFFPMAREGRDYRKEWREIVEGLDTSDKELA